MKAEGRGTPGGWLAFIVLPLCSKEKGLSAAVATDRPFGSSSLRLAIG